MISEIQSFTQINIFLLYFNQGLSGVYQLQDSPQSVHKLHYLIQPEQKSCPGETQHCTIQCYSCHN